MRLKTIIEALKSVLKQITEKLKSWRRQEETKEAGKVFFFYSDDYKRWERSIEKRKTRIEVIKKREFFKTGINGRRENKTRSTNQKEGG